jgi:broad specificity phosphatase PhoE
MAPVASEEKIQGTRILLVRHGETEWNRTWRFQGRSDLPLNETGKKQAHALAVALKDEPIHAVYSSPLIRALETAGIIGAFHKEAPISQEEDLIEMDLGEFDGMDARQWAKLHADIRKIWMETPARVQMPGGEGLPQVQTRAIRALKRITRGQPHGCTVLVCSHNFVILTILCYAMQIPLNRFREVKQETAAMSVLHMDGDYLSVQMVNDRSHLESEENEK